MTNQKTLTLRRIGKGLLVAGLLTAGVLASRGALAGSRVPLADWQVKISGTTTGYFSGSIAAARNSGDSKQYIGCDLTWSGPAPGKTTAFTPVASGYCMARTADGTMRACNLSPKYDQVLPLLGTFNEASMLKISYFTTPEGDVHCSVVKVYNYSDNI